MKTAGWQKSRPHCWKPCRKCIIWQATINSDAIVYPVLWSSALVTKLWVRVKSTWELGETEIKENLIELVDKSTIESLVAEKEGQTSGLFLSGVMKIKGITEVISSALGSKGGIVIFKYLDDRRNGRNWKETKHICIKIAQRYLKFFATTLCYEATTVILSNCFIFRSYTSKSRHN